jgi:hypothetical protein
MMSEELLVKGDIEEKLKRIKAVKEAAKKAMYEVV